jgi:hypothetical protein
MDKVQKTNGSQCYIPSLEPFRINLILTVIRNIILLVRATLVYNDTKYSVPFMTLLPVRLYFLLD